MILVIDNYDSFTYNLVQLVQKILLPDGEEVKVFRNDAITLEDIARLQPERILLSPGPGRPENAGVTMEVIRHCGRTTPILGVCLGHQAIAAAFGARIVRASAPMHGRTSFIVHDGTSIFRGVANPLRATRYHSLVIEPASVPPEIEVIARSDDGVIMGIRHKSWPLVGVQFHPEAILTQEGEALMRNWLVMQDSR